jgi:cytochrome c-type biogenesis protein CcmH
MSARHSREGGNPGAVRTGVHRTWIVAFAGMTFALLMFFASLASAIDPMPFKDAAEEARFRALAAELRCVLCQNQSLADSNAGIAQDLRREEFDLMRQGKSDEEIKQFLTARYTDFVLYKPRVDTRTWLIWFGPALVLLGGAIAVVVIVRRRARSAGPDPLPAPEEDW